MGCAKNKLIALDPCADQLRATRSFSLTKHVNIIVFCLLTHLRLCLHSPSAKGAAFEVFLLPNVVAARSV